MQKAKCDKTDGSSYRKSQALQHGGLRDSGGRNFVQTVKDSKHRINMNMPRLKISKSVLGRGASLSLTSRYFSEDFMSCSQCFPSAVSDSERR